MNLKTTHHLFLTLIFALATALTSHAADSSRNAAEYNLQGNIGLKGYDPVSYWQEGGSQPRIGDSSIFLDYEGVRYFFSSENNKDLFELIPEKYEPTYGGWCAWAMANGSKVDINPEIYTLSGNRIHFFVGNRPKRNFERDIQKYEALADKNWKNFSGENPRL